MRTERLILTLISILMITSCHQKTIKSEFIDNMKVGDTLVLYAMFADCGEWGGHIEKICLTKFGNGLYANLYIDSVSCATDPNDTRKKLLEKTQKLSAMNINMIATYISKLNIVGKIKPDGISNTCDLYKITSKDTSMEYKDYNTNWKEFKILRHAIFK